MPPAPSCWTRPGTAAWACCAPRSRAATTTGTWCRSRPTNWKSAATKACTRSWTSAKIGGAARYLPGAVHACGVGAIIYNLVLAYDGDKLKTAPNGWADFFDSKKVPGKRSIRNGAKWNLEVALIADGVPAKDVYKTLATPGRRGPRVQEARHHQARPGVLEERRAAAADAGRRRRGDDHRLQRPHHRRQREGQEELQDGLEGHALHDGQLGHHEGHAEQGQCREAGRVHGPARQPGQAAEVRALRRHRRGCRAAGRQEPDRANCRPTPTS
jgi:hypothetical protein